MFHTLPEELKLRIFSFLSHTDLQSAAGVSSDWYRLSNENGLWQSLCKKLWKDKQIQKNSLFYFADYSKCEEQLSFKEIKEILQAREISFDKYTIDKKQLCKLLNSTFPSIMPKVSFPSKWKTSFVGSLFDSKRISITNKELCDSEWSFEFKQVELQTVLDDAVDGQKYMCTFHSDGSYSNNIFPNSELTWRFFRYEYVQVDSYPPLESTRTADWGWQLENGSVFMMRKADLNK